MWRWRWRRSVFEGLGLQGCCALRVLRFNGLGPPKFKPPKFKPWESKPWEFKPWEFKLWEFYRGIDAGCRRAVGGSRRCRTARRRDDRARRGTSSRAGARHRGVAPPAAAGDVGDGRLCGPIGRRRAPGGTAQGDRRSGGGPPLRKAGWAPPNGAHFYQRR